jgi:hypothetical protein
MAGYDISRITKGLGLGRIIWIELKKSEKSDTVR